MWREKWLGQCLCCAAFAVVCMMPIVARAVGPEDAEEWSDYPEGILAQIMSPATDTYVPINTPQTLDAFTDDTDCYRIGTEWYTYSDDVSTGTTESTYHVWWTKTGDGTFTSIYGTSVEYNAPAYSAGNDVRDVTITVHADDFQRGDDTYGDTGDGEGNDTITLKIWQITITVSQNGTTSGNYDGTAVPAEYGGTDLGWVVPGTPANATRYAGNTQLTGAIPEGVPVTTGFQWYQEKKGVKQHKVNGGPWIPDYSQAAWEADFGPGYGFLDADSRHPNGTGTNAREIFAMDAPGFNGGAANNNYIGNGWTDVNFDMDYRPRVELNSRVISNQPEYEIIFTLDVVNNTWHVVGAHTPAN